MLATTPIRFHNSEHVQLRVHFSALYATHIHSFISHLQFTTWPSSVYLYRTYVRHALHIPFAFNKVTTILLHATAGFVEYFACFVNQVGTQRCTYVVGDIWDILVVEENAMLETKMVIPTLSPPSADNLQMFVALPISLHRLLMAQGEAKASARSASSYFLCHPILHFLFLLFCFMFCI